MAIYVSKQLFCSLDENVFTLDAFRFSDIQQNNLNESAPSEIDELYERYLALRQIIERKNEWEFID